MTPCRSNPSPEQNAVLRETLRADIPPHVAETIRSLHPDLTRSIKFAVRAIAADPECGEPLLRELDGLWTFRVRRFRIVYAVDRKADTVRLMAVGHRQSVYEELTATLRKRKHRGADCQVGTLAKDVPNIEKPAKFTVFQSSRRGRAEFETMPFL